MTTPLGSSSAFRRRLTQWRLRSRSAKWIRNGRVPGTSGYSAARWSAIERGLSERTDLGYGYHDAGLDERVVEYPWALHRLKERWIPGMPILDAGSALNHPPILAYCRREKLRPDFRRDAALRRSCGRVRRCAVRVQRPAAIAVSRRLVLERRVPVDARARRHGQPHVRRYRRRELEPTHEVARALAELRRVTGPGGVLLLSVPFGRRDDRGWFRILDAADLLLSRNRRIRAWTTPGSCAQRQGLAGVHRP